MRLLILSLVISFSMSSWAEVQPDERQLAPKLNLPATPSKVETPGPLNMPAGPKTQ